MKFFWRKISSWFKNEGVVVETGNGVPQHVRKPMSKEFARTLITEQDRVEAQAAWEEIYKQKRRSEDRLSVNILKIC